MRPNKHNRPILYDLRPQNSSKLYDTKVGFRPSSENSGEDETQMVHPVGRVNVKLPLTAASELLSGQDVTPMVCVNDWKCPHVKAGVNEGAFGTNNLDYFMNSDGLIEVDSSEKYEDLFYPHARVRDDHKASHRYVLTPLDISELPERTLPGTLYYDSNSNGLLDDGEKPIMTNFQHIHRKLGEDGETIEYPDVDEYMYGGNGNNVTQLVSSEHDYDLPRFNFNVVTLADFEAGCDGLDSSDEADHSFKHCDTKISYVSGPKD